MKKLGLIPLRMLLAGAADASGMAATRSLPASRAAPVEPQPSSTHGDDAATAAAVAPPATANGNNEGQGTIADALHRFLRPSAFHRPAAAAPAQPRHASHIPPLQSLPHLRSVPPHESSHAAPHENHGVASLPAGQNHLHVARDPQQQEQEQQEQAAAPDPLVQLEDTTTATAAATRETAEASPHPEQPQVPLLGCLKCCLGHR